MHVFIICVTDPLTFFPARVRTFIICTECGKRRCIYCKQRLSREMLICIERLQEELVYSCGGSLLPNGHEFEEVLVIRQGLTCSSPIEITYYGGTLIKYTCILGK